MGAGKKKTSEFSGTAQAFFPLLFCQSHQPDRASGAV